MARNFKNLEGKRKYLETAYDDRLKEFHEGRFLPGPLCPIGDYWTAAKVYLPERGHEPVAHYDGQGLGLAYHVAAKTWATVHDPGNTELNIGMFAGGRGCQQLRLELPSLHSGQPQQLQADHLHSQGRPPTGSAVEPLCNSSTPLPGEQPIRLQVLLERKGARATAHEFQ